MSTSSGIAFEAINLGDCVDAGISDDRNHHTITNNNGVVVRGMHGRGVYFNGTNAYLDCGNDSSLNITDAITIEAWVNPTTFASPTKVYLSKGAYEQDGWYLGFLTDGRLEFNYNIFEESNSGYSNFSKIQNLSWDHIVVVVNNGDSVCFYFNGSYDKCASMVISFTGLASRNLIVGAYNTAGSSPFNGTIDEVRIYNYALDADTIKLHYRTQSPYYHTEVVPTIIL